MPFEFAQTMMKKVFAMLLMLALCMGVATITHATGNGSFVATNRNGFWPLDEVDVLAIAGTSTILS